MPDGFDAFVRALNPLLQSTQSKTRCDGLIRLGYSAQSASFFTFQVLVTMCAWKIMLYVTFVVNVWQVDTFLKPLLIGI